jgi:prepilin-type N-terminal cleavage/methylation domain-containing protein
MSYQFWRYPLKKLLGRSSFPRTRDISSMSGFTLIELLVVIVAVGVLTAIAAPSWLAFNNKQKLNSATNSAFTAIKSAQSLAKRESRPRYVTFDTATNKITGELGQPISIDSGVKILSVTYNGTPQTGTCANVNSVLFDEKGTPFQVALPTASPCTPNLSSTRRTADIPIQITFKHDALGQTQCITIRTLLGSVDTNCN